MKKLKGKQTTQVRQEQIKKAALALISGGGMAALSTRALAAKIGVSEGALFRHFDSKMDIFLAIAGDLRRDMAGKVEEIAAGKGPADKRLFECLCQQIKYLRANEGINILLFSEAAHYNDSRLKKELLAVMRSIKGSIIRVIEDGIKAGLWRELISVDDAAALYMGIPITFSMELVLNKKGVDMEGFCKRMFFLMSGALDVDKA